MNLEGHGKLKEIMTQAEGQFSRGEWNPLGANIRLALEYMVRCYVTAYKPDILSEEMRLFDYINALEDNGIISSPVARKMHNIRICCNGYGSHIENLEQEKMYDLAKVAGCYNDIAKLVEKEFLITFPTLEYVKDEKLRKPLKVKKSTAEDKKVKKSAMEDKKPSIKAETKVKKPSIKAESETKKPSIKAESETKKPSIKAETEAKKPSIKAETEIKKPSIKAETEAKKPSIKAEAEIKKPSIKAEAETKKSSEKSVVSIKKGEKNKVDNEVKKLSFNSNILDKNVVTAKTGPNDKYAAGPYIVENQESFWILGTVMHDSEDSADVIKNLKMSFKVEKVSGKKYTVCCRIQSDNTEPLAKEYKLDIISEREFEIEVYKGSAFMYTSLKGLHGGNNTSIQLEDSIMTPAGVLLGYDNQDGNFPGGKGNTITVSIKVKVKY